jgi:hypothetical protein
MKGLINIFTSERTRWNITNSCLFKLGMGCLGVIFIVICLGILLLVNFLPQ